MGLILIIHTVFLIRLLNRLQGNLKLLPHNVHAVIAGGLALKTRIRAKHIILRQSPHNFWGHILFFMDISTHFFVYLLIIPRTLLPTLRRFIIIWHRCLLFLLLDPEVKKAQIMRILFLIPSLLLLVPAHFLTFCLKGTVNVHFIVLNCRIEVIFSIENLFNDIQIIFINIYLIL